MPGRNKIVLSTLPTEGEFVNWTTSEDFTKSPTVVKYMPLGILSLATNLPYDEVKILDPPSEGWTIDETIEQIEKENPDILGLSAITRRTWALKEILERIDVYKVVGGPHATHYADLILRQGADAVFIGQLADKEFAEIGNRPKGKIHCKTGINEIAFPRRDFLNMEDYIYKGKVLFEAERRMPMFSSVGCPNVCTFCNVQSKQIQFKHPKTIVDEMEYLYDLGSRSIHILDDNFNINSSHLKGFLTELESRLQVEWSGRGQVRMDYSLVEQMKDTGFKRIHVGIEALDDNILRYFKKPQKVRHIEKFCEVMNKNDIDILGYFILGSPIETEEYGKTLPQKIKDLGIKMPWFNILFPEPNTPYYESLLGKEYQRDYWKEFMENPSPSYEIPYPYGNEKLNELTDYIKEIK